MSLDLIIMIKKFLNWFKNNKLQALVIIFLIILFFIMSLKYSDELFMSVDESSIRQIQNQAYTEKLKTKSDEPYKVIIFYQPTCQSCKKQHSYIDRVLSKKFLDVQFESHDITLPKEISLMKRYFRKYGIDINKLETPTTFIGNDYMIGYENDEESGKQLEMLIKKNFFIKELTKSEQQTLTQSQKNTVDHVDTWFGRINIVEKSLPVLAVTLGLIDGFNPCAMWVLAYLISLIIGLNDKRKIWLIVGSFVFASGVLYYLFMTALLSIFLYIGYLRILGLLAGCVALYIGIMNLKVYFLDKGKLVCKVGGEESKKKTMSRIEKLVNAEISVMTILGIIALAFVVNSMEFVCSAALPAVFTSILAQADLSIISYYLYILLYVVFFMLDDLVIFGLAAFAVDCYSGDRYMIHCKLIGGIILVALGIIMVFFPEYLR